MFYVNTDTKLFIPVPRSDSYPVRLGCGCGDPEDKPIFLSTCQSGPFYSKIDKPVIYNYATNILQFMFLDNEGLPYDLTACTLALAIDNTFNHSDSLVALADGDVLSPLDGIVEFKVNRFSKKFAQLLKSGIPASQIWMQITAYTKSGDQIVLLQDRGIKLSTKLLLNQGLTQDNLLNFYNKQQINAFLMDLGRYQLLPGKVIITQSSNSSLQSGSLYIDRYNRDFYLEVSDSLVYLGNLDKSDYYTKEEVQQIAAALSDSIEGLRQALNNYYDKFYIDELESKISNSIADLKQDLYDNYYIKSRVDQIASALSNSIASVKSSLNNYYTIQQTDQFLGTKASNSYVQQINQQVQDLKQLHVVKLNTPQQGFAATYQLQDRQGNPLGASINIFKDKFLSGADLIVASQQDHEAEPGVIVGDPYLKLIFNTQPATTVYISVKYLVDIYNAGQGLKLQNNTFSVESDQQEDSIKFLQIGAHTIGLKGITAAVNKALSDAKTYTDVNLQSYYTKSQVNSIAASLSNSITALKQELHGNYYTSTRIDQITGAISDSIAVVKSTFSSYYSKEQVDALIAAVSNSVDLSNYYTKPEVDALVAELSNSTDLSNYYTKDQVNAIAAALSNSITAVKGIFNNYYDKEQIDEFFRQFSDSVDLGNYYTKIEIDTVVSALSDSISKLKQELHSSYYTNIQVDSLLQDLSNSIAGVKSSLGSYYTKSQVDALVAGLSNSTDLNDYYTKSQVDAIIVDYCKVNVSDNLNWEDPASGLYTRLGRMLNGYPVYRKGATNYYLWSPSGSDWVITDVDPEDDLTEHILFANNGTSDVTDWPQPISVIPVKASDSMVMSNYYTKSQTEGLIQQLSNSIASIKSSLNSYYTSTQVDQIVGTLSNSIQGVRTSLQGYYNKDQVDAIAGTLSNSITAIKSSLSSYYTGSQVDAKLVDYYTKSQVEGFLGSLSDSIDAVKSTFSSYYNKEQVDAFISSISDSLEALDNKITQQKNYNNLTNKPSLEGVTLQGNLVLSDFGLPQFIGSYMQFTAVDANNQYTLNGTTTIPVAVLTGANHIYLIQKGSLLYDTVNQSLIFDATPYMAYDDMQTFTGTWRLYFAAGNSPKDGDLILPKTSTSIVPQHGLIIRHTLQANDTILISTSQLTSDRQVTFQLHLIQPSTAVSFTLPSTLIWGNFQGVFNSSNAAPAMNASSTLYCIVIRWDGSDLLANLAYIKEIN